MVHYTSIVDDFLILVDLRKNGNIVTALPHDTAQMFKRTGYLPSCSGNNSP